MLVHKWRRCPLSWPMFDPHHTPPQAQRRIDHHHHHHHRLFYAPSRKPSTPMSPLILSNKHTSQRSSSNIFANIRPNSASRVSSTKCSPDVAKSVHPHHLRLSSALHSLLHSDRLHQSPLHPRGHHNSQLQPIL